MSHDEFSELYKELILFSIIYFCSIFLNSLVELHLILFTWIEHYVL